MRVEDAAALLGGKSSVCRALGVSFTSLRSWGEVLPERWERKLRASEEYRDALVLACRLKREFPLIERTEEAVA